MPSTDWDSPVEMQCGISRWYRLIGAAKTGILRGHSLAMNQACGS